MITKNVTLSNTREGKIQKRLMKFQSWINSANQPFRKYRAQGNRVFSHDVTAAILVSQNNETAAMLVSQTNPLGVELFSYANALFCSDKFA